MKRNWDSIFALLRAACRKNELPSVSQVALELRDPFRVLISTIISLRTKDQVTLEASRRLFEAADTPAAMAELSEETIARLIYPAGFYRNKAAQIRTISRTLCGNGGAVPSDPNDLLALPGVGRKTANLTLNLGFGIDAICVDTHVHRISNRLDWVRTKTPEETEFALMEILPKKYWIEINELLVSFGQTVCTPQSPRCSACVLFEQCPRVGVGRAR